MVGVEVIMSDRTGMCGSFDNSEIECLVFKKKMLSRIDFLSSVTFVALSRYSRSLECSPAIY